MMFFYDGQDRRTQPIPVIKGYTDGNIANKPYEAFEQLVCL